MVRRHAARAAANERFRRTGGRWADLLYTRSLVVQVLDLVERGCEMERRRAATTTKRATAGPKMSSARQPRVELSTPERGWITFSLDVDGHHFEEQLWHVPVDFVTNLASAVAGIAEGRGSHSGGGERGVDRAVPARVHGLDGHRHAHDRDSTLALVDVAHHGRDHDSRLPGTTPRAPAGLLAGLPAAPRSMRRDRVRAPVGHAPSDACDRQPWRTRSSEPPEVRGLSRHQCAHRTPPLRPSSGEARA
jgi:hypothetical protein